MAKIHYNIEKDNGIPCQPINISGSSSKTFRVMYFEERVSVKFFHVLTDGSGGMIFLKTLIHTYFDLLGIESEKVQGVLDISEHPSQEDTANEFLNVPLTNNTSGFIDKKALQMSGKLSKHKPNQVLHLTLDSTKLKDITKNYNTTVTGYLLSQMFIAMLYSTDGEKNDFNIQVPVNMRKFYPSNTVRNFSMYCGIRVPLNEIKDIRDTIQKVDEQLKDKANLKSMSEMMSSSSKMVKSLRFIPLFIKQPIVKAAFGFLGDLVFTNTLSNLGVVKVPHELSSHIRKFDFVLGPSITNRAACAVITFNNKTVFSITKTTSDPSYEQRLIENFEKDGILTDVEGNYER